MSAAVESSAQTDPEQGDREAQSDRIARLINVGDKEAALGRNAEATYTYYSVFQPDLCARATGLRRLAPIDLYIVAAEKLRMVAKKYAALLIEHDGYLPVESGSGIIGVPRGALNVYLISNQYGAFAKLALEYAVAQFPKRDISRFLLSSIRARLHHLEEVRACATLLEEEQLAFATLAGFRAELQVQLAAHIAKTGRQPCSFGRRPEKRAMLKYA